MPRHGRIKIARAATSTSTWGSQYLCGTRERKRTSKMHCRLGLARAGIELPVEGRRLWLKIVDEGAEFEHHLHNAAAKPRIEERDDDEDRCVPLSCPAERNVARRAGAKMQSALPQGEPGKERCVARPSACFTDGALQGTPSPAHTPAAAKAACAELPKTAAQSQARG